MNDNAKRRVQSAKLRSSFIKIFLSFAFCVLRSALPLWAAFEAKQYSARATGMGGAYTAVADDAGSIYANPAGLAWMDGPEIATSQTTLLGQKDLGYLLFSAAFPTKLGTLGFSYDQFGPQEYRERQGIFSHGFTFQKLDLGYNVKYMNLSLGGGLGEASVIAWDAGLKLWVLECLSLGFFARNINRPLLGQSTESPASSTMAGAAFYPFSFWTVAFDVEKSPRFPASLHIGQEWTFAKFLVLRAGGQTEPKRYSVGLGFGTAFFRLDYAFLTHQVLDDQHHFSLLLRWDRNR